MPLLPPRPPRRPSWRAHLRELVWCTAGDLGDAQRAELALEVLQLHMRARRQRRGCRAPVNPEAAALAQPATKNCWRTRRPAAGAIGVGQGPRSLAHLGQQLSLAPRAQLVRLDHSCRGGGCQRRARRHCSAHPDAVRGGAARLQAKAHPFRQRWASRRLQNTRERALSGVRSRKAPAAATLTPG